MLTSESIKEKVINQSETIIEKGGVQKDYTSIE
jgi:hypothetical protein